MNTERPPKISIPIKRIERLIEMAKRHNLACLEIGHIKIIPEPKPPQIAPSQSPATPILRNGKPLTPRQKEDAILFGMDGITDE
jgi:hypothetical protein